MAGWVDALIQIIIIIQVETVLSDSPTFGNKSYLQQAADSQ